MSTQFRRPFMVVSTRALYNGMGQTDPETRTFTELGEAMDYYRELSDDGHDAYVLVRNPGTGEWEE